LWATVYIDTHLVTRNFNAYVPFKVDITEYAAGKDSVQLLVQVDNRLRNDRFPDTYCDGWWIYGGLIREVFLESYPRNRLEKLTIRTFYHQKDTFRLHLTYRHTNTVPDSVLLYLKAPAGTSVWDTCVPGFPTEHSFYLDSIRSWSPEDPFRYTIEIVPCYGKLHGEPLTVCFGFSQLTTNKTKLLLNGEQIFIRGYARHDVIGRRGPLLTRQERLNDLLTLKEKLHVNAIRNAHFPQHPDMYKLCDSLGIIILDEMPAWKTSIYFLGSDKGKSRAKSYMQQLIDAYGNHTCIQMWSIGNQFRSNKKPAIDFIHEMSTFIRSTDPSRLVTFCSYYHMLGDAQDALDVISINEYFGWFFGSLSWLRRLLHGTHKKWPDKPILITETGAAARYGQQNDSPNLAGAIRTVISKDMSEDYQALFVASQIDSVWACREYCSGLFLWNYTNFYEPRNRPTSSKPPGLNHMGIMTLDRKRKKAFEVAAEKYKSIMEVDSSGP